MILDTKESLWYFVFKTLETKIILISPETEIIHIVSLRLYNTFRISQKGQTGKDLMTHGMSEKNARKFMFQ